MPTTAQWIEQALTGEVCNIGQIDRQTDAALNRLARAGRLTKERGLWAGLSLKTVWRAAE